VSRSRAAATVLFAIASFGAAVALRAHINPWISTTAAALLSLALAWPLVRSELRVTERTWTSVVLSLALGGVLALLTHGAYRVALEIVPELVAAVPALYESLEAPPGPLIAAPLVVLIVFVEEIVWRGVLVRALSEQPAMVVFLFAVVAYVVPQLASGAIELVLAALVLGSLFTLQRQVTRRLLDPVLTHAVWSLSIFCLFPLR